VNKFEKRRPATVFQIYTSLYQNVIYTAGKSFSYQLLCGRDFANERLWLRQFDV